MKYFMSIGCRVDPLPKSALATSPSWGQFRAQAFTGVKACGLLVHVPIPIKDMGIYGLCTDFGQS